MLKYVLLGLLATAPRHGYDLKGVFEELLGGTWPVNVAQVYTALTRLERDGFVDCEVVPQSAVPDRKVYSLTELGEKELRRWLDEPVAAPVQLRDEFLLKVCVRSLGPRGDTLSLIGRQRQASVRALAEVVRLRDDPTLALPTQLLLDAAVLRLEADLKWLDRCEERLARKGGKR